jgi:hypothetical protein
MVSVPRNQRKRSATSSLSDGAKVKKSGKNGATKGATASEKKPITSQKEAPTFAASLYSWPPTLPEEFVSHVRALEEALKQEVWLIIHTREFRNINYGSIDYSTLDALTRVKGSLPKPERDEKTGKMKPRVALLIHSGGGIGEPAYRIASLFKRRCGAFTAVVPRIAKSAATLLCLGAETIYLGEEAELGPLDAQYPDFDVEEDWVSALDEVQAVEALEQSAIETAYHVMVYLHERTRKKLNVLMPHALHFAAEITKPLFEKIDSISYSRQSRRLQEAQDYAERLIRPKVGEEAAKAIAHDLVRNYPTHDFVIDRQEAKQVGKLDGRPPVGLQIGPDNKDLNDLLDWFYGHFGSSRMMCAIGRLEERKPTAG